MSSYRPVTVRTGFQLLANINNNQFTRRDGRAGLGSSPGSSSSPSSSASASDCETRAFSARTARRTHTRHTRPRVYLNNLPNWLCGTRLTSLSSSTYPGFQRFRVLWIKIRDVGLSIQWTDSYSLNDRRPRPGMKGEGEREVWAVSRSWARCFKMM